jgi:hypothetical protein
MATGGLLKMDEEKMNRMAEVKYEDFVTGLPKIALANNLERCCVCEMAWLDVDGKPDFNHCQPMLDTLQLFKAMEDTSMLDTFKKVSEHKEIICPFYMPKSQSKYKDYSRLFSFSINSEEYHIAAREHGVFLHAEDSRVRIIALEFLPIPGGYDTSTGASVNDTRGTNSLDFKLLEVKEGQAFIHVGISDDYEYWSYGAGDDWHPGSSYEEKLLKVRREGDNLKYEFGPVKL